MEDIVLMEAIERYLNGELGEAEKLQFEALRRENADLDQMVVEQLFFLKQMENYNQQARFKETMEQVHAKMAAEAPVVPMKPKAKMVHFWNRYRKTVAVAATIAALISVSALGLLMVYNKKERVNYEDLNRKLDNTASRIDKRINNLETKEKPRFQPKPNTSFSGTGFVIDPRGYLVTNAHVARKKDLYVFNEKTGSLKAELLYTDRDNDLAILKITDTAFKQLKPLPYTLAKTEPELGQRIFTLGYPRPEQIYYEGYISSRSTNGTMANPDVFLLNLPVENGNSGSPVLNQKGVITGIISSKEISQSGYAAAIKPRALNNLIAALQRDEKLTPLPARAAIANLERTEQVRRIGDYVFMVEVE